MKTKTYFFTISLLYILLLIQSVSFSQSVWTTQYLNNIGGNELRRVQFINQYTGWACGASGTLIKTTNAGDTWVVTNLSSTSYLTCLYFVDENTGWVGSQQAVIKKTTNGGVSWYSAPIQTTDYSADFFFLDSQTGFVTSHDSKIHKTTNGGQTWNLLISSSHDYGQIQFFNANTGFVIASSYFAKSIDGGVNWTQILFNGTMQAMTFLNQQTGWVSGISSIRKTTNGGDSWATYTLPIQNPYTLKFFNENIGWCAGKSGSNGVIARTLNGGANWTVQATEIGNVFWEMSFINQATGWASGNAIISNTQNGSLTSVSQISTNVPDKFSLKQNYPNPFNPSTKISFNIKNATFASLKVFDMTGKEVKSLINENVAAGSFEVTFNASELNSGVYFYTLKTNEFTETKKMMLVK